MGDIIAEALFYQAIRLKIKWKKNNSDVESQLTYKEHNQYENFVDLLFQKQFQWICHCTNPM